MEVDVGRETLVQNIQKWVYLDNQLKKINENGKTVIMSTHDYAVIMKFPAKTLKCEDNTIFEVVQKLV